MEKATRRDRTSHPIFVQLAKTTHTPASRRPFRLNKMFTFCFAEKRKLNATQKNRERTLYTRSVWVSAHAATTCWNTNKTERQKKNGRENSPNWIIYAVLWSGWVCVCVCMCPVLVKHSFLAFLSLFFGLMLESVRWCRCCCCCCKSKFSTWTGTISPSILLLFRFLLICLLALDMGSIHTFRPHRTFNAVVACTILTNGDRVWRVHPPPLPHTHTHIHIY